MGHVSNYLELDGSLVALTRFGLRPSRVRARVISRNSKYPFLPKQSSLIRGVPCVVLFPKCFLMDIDKTDNVR